MCDEVEEGLAERLLAQIKRAGYAADFDPVAHADRIAREVERSRRASSPLIPMAVLRDMPEA